MHLRSLAGEITAQRTAHCLGTVRPVELQSPSSSIILTGSLRNKTEGLRDLTGGVNNDVAYLRIPMGGLQERTYDKKKLSLSHEEKSPLAHSVVRVLLLTMLPQRVAFVSTGRYDGYWISIVSISA